MKESNTVRKEYDFSNARRGPVLASPGKTRITIMLDDDVIAYFRAAGDSAGSGYQTRINAALRAAMAAQQQVRQQGRASDDQPLTVATLRQVLREALQP